LLSHLKHTYYRMATLTVRVATKAVKAFALTALVLTSLMGVYAATPLAGSSIHNTAQATFFDTDRGISVAVSSNTVRVFVQPLEALVLTGADNVTRPLGGFVALPHRLSNTGNSTSSYVLTYANRAGDDYDLLNLGLVWDQNSNGVADSGESKLSNGANFGPLAPGQSADFVLTGLVPTNVVTDRVAGLDFTATTLLQAARSSHIDTIRVGNGAQFQVVKSASNVTPRAGDAVTFVLTANNTGNQAATGISVLVDGAPQSLVLLKDVIPANTTFNALGAVGAARGLYHLRGQPDLSFSSTPPADLRLVDSVAFGFPTPIVANQSVSRSLDVKINTNASGAVVNTASITFMDGVLPSVVSVDSNQVSLLLPAPPPAIRLFASPQYTIQTAVLSVGNPFYVALEAAQCNIDPLRAETHLVTITSQLTGDTEVFAAVETSVNTGEFRIASNVPTIDFASKAVTHGDGVLAVKQNDRIVASSAGCGATQVQASLLVDPFGVVFDSKTNVPISNAIVTLIDVTGAGNGGQAGAPAKVFLADGVTPAPSTVTTGTDGHFQFPLVAPSIYRLQVTPPPGYSFSSVLPSSLLPPGRIIDAQGSYGGSFVVSLIGGPVQIDIPVDADSQSGLLIEKSASRKTVEMGEFLDYTIKVKNVSGQLLGRIQLTDRLPAGFAYLPATARLNASLTRLDGSPMPEPFGGVGPLLVFAIGSIPDQAVLTLSYRVRIGPGALQGDGINRAQARSAAPLVKISNESSAFVQVLPGVFTDQSFLIGTVYADCNNNRVHDEDEPGVPGVRLYLEDGTHVITDARGKYSLYGLHPKTHVLKLDRSTLPSDAGELAMLANRHMGDAGSRFIDLKNGELHKADFAVQGCSASLRQTMEARVLAVQATDRVRQDKQATQLAADTRALLGVGNGKGLPGSNASGPASSAAATALDVARPAQPATSRPTRQTSGTTAVFTDEQIAAMDNSLTVLAPVDGQVLGFAQTSVTVKGDIAATLTVRLNGELLPAARIGRHSKSQVANLQVLEYVGIDLKPGKNSLEVIQEIAGGKKTSSSIVVVAPGALARLAMSAPGQALPADGRSVVPVIMDILDASDVPVAARTAITLDTTLGQWRTRDLNPDEPGVQIFVEGGRAELELESPGQSGDAILRATSGSIATQTKLNFVPELRPLIAAGVIEGVLNLRKLDSRALLPARAQDGFEQELRRVADNLNGGRGSASARAALFLKGKVSGEYLLTLAYDSDKAAKERLFRDIQPGEFYPVYGDSSVAGFDAQSTSRLYVRVDKGRSHVFYGDYSTQIDAVQAGPGSAGDERRLNQYNRSLTGAKSHIESADGRSRVTAFASRARSSQIVDEQPARGVSGPYVLGRSPVVENSESVEILVRDRNLPATVLQTQKLTRFVDYEIDFATGRILLKAPLPTLAANFNPNSLRITYELEQGGEQFWVAGVDASHQVTGGVTVGAAFVRDNDPLKPLTIQSAGVTAKLGEHAVVAVELARTETPLSTQTRGEAGRAEIRYEDSGLTAQAHLVKASAGFGNPTAAVTRGVEEAGVKGSYKVNDNLLLKGEYLRSVDSTTQVRREGAQTGFDYTLNDKVRAEIGLRHSHVSEQAPSAATPAIAPQNTTSARVKIIGQVPNHPQASLFTEYEQDVENSTRRTAVIGGEYRLDNGARLYGRHELISSLGSTYGLNDVQQRNATVFGVQTDTTKDANVFSEYRVRDAIAGREAEVAVGLRNRWQLSDGVRLSAGYERVSTLGGAGANDSTVLTGGIEYTGAPDWKGSARLELRKSAGSDSLLGTMGSAYRIDETYSALAKNVLSVTKNQGGANKTEDWAQIGLAYRGVAPNRHNALFRAEYRWEKTDEPTALDSQRNVGILSMHHNYQPDPDWVLSGRVAAKWVSDRSAGLISRYDTQLLSARATYDLSKRWDIGVNAAALLGGRARARQTGLGAELGYLVTDNLWFSVGYNVFGFTDKDLSAQDYTNRGLYMRLRWKFDENLFQGSGK
jgi:large repetitive protein